MLALWGVRLILGRPLNWPWLPAGAAARPAGRCGLPGHLAALGTVAVLGRARRLRRRFPAASPRAADRARHLSAGHRPCQPAPAGPRCRRDLARGVAASRATAGMTGRWDAGEPEPRWAQAVHRVLAPGARVPRDDRGARRSAAWLISGCSAGSPRLRRGDERRRPAAAQAGATGSDPGARRGARGPRPCSRRSRRRGRPRRPRPAAVSGARGRAGRWRAGAGWQVQAAAAQVPRPAPAAP